ncbi:IS1 family transposase [Bradyrhizobium algeriense]|uniref:IS1 family transposase n=1 Tax=Bradyrhizobium algeriense TaxID=634784 RepID=UPI00167D288F
MGNPDPKRNSTSFVERQNLTMRMSMRRLTRFTNAFSKKFENHCHALALYFFFYNFCRVHKTLGVTPAMVAAVTDRIMKMESLVEIIGARNAPGPRGKGLDEAHTPSACRFASTRLPMAAEDGLRAAFPMREIRRRSRWLACGGLVSRSAPNVRSMGYAALEARQIERGCQLLAQAVDQLRSRRLS